MLFLSKEYLLQVELKTLFLFVKAFFTGLFRGFVSMDPAHYNIDCFVLGILAISLAILIRYPQCVYGNEGM